jgi:hypothetical protein
MMAAGYSVQGPWTRHVAAMSAQLTQVLLESLPRAHFTF